MYLKQQPKRRLNLGGFEAYRNERKTVNDLKVQILDVALIGGLLSSSPLPKEFPKWVTIIIIIYLFILRILLLAGWKAMKHSFLINILSSCLFISSSTKDMLCFNTTLVKSHYNRILLSVIRSSLQTTLRRKRKSSKPCVVSINCFV